MIYNRIPAVVGPARAKILPPINYQCDVGQILEISGIDLPEYFEVDFCNQGDSQTITMIAQNGEVEIPDEFLATGKPVMAYFVVTGIDEGAVETRYELTIPVNRRPTRTDIEPTPADQLQIDGLISALNDGVSRAETAADTAVDAADRAEQGASSAGWVRFYIDESGDLHYVKTENADLDFYIDSDGNLHVTDGGV